MVNPWNEVRESYIYGLYDSRYPTHIRYVGLTQRTLKARMADHVRDLSDPRKNTYHKSRWMRKVMNEGSTVGVVTLWFGATSLRDLSEDEKWWIASIRAWGHDLTNMSEGGEGRTGPVRSEVRAAMRTRVISAETRAKMAASRRGTKLSPKVRMNMANAQRKRFEHKTYSAEDRALMRERAVSSWDRNRSDAQWMSKFSDAVVTGMQPYLLSRTAEDSRRLSERRKEYWSQFSAEERSQMCAPTTPLTTEQKTNAARKSRYFWDNMSEEYLSGHKELVSTKTKEAMSRPEVRQKQLEGMRNRDPEKKALQYFKTARTVRYNRAKKNGWVLDIAPVEHICKDTK